jgi:hypothetical protein
LPGLTTYRVNRYANFQMLTPTLSMVPDGQPLSPDRGFSSPGLLVRTKSSGTNRDETWNQQTFPLLPQAATGLSTRINPSFSTNDIPSLNNHAAPGGPPPQRSASMVFTPGAGPSSQPPPQPTGLPALPLRVVDGASGAVVGQAPAALDGFEPRMFPGIVNRRRALSVAQGSSSDSEGLVIGRVGYSTNEADAAFDAVAEEYESDSDEE